MGELEKIKIELNQRLHDRTQAFLSKEVKYLAQIRKQNRTIELLKIGKCPCVDCEGEENWHSNHCSWMSDLHV